MYTLTTAAGELAKMHKRHADAAREYAKSGANEMALAMHWAQSRTYQDRLLQFLNTPLTPADLVGEKAVFVGWQEMACYRYEHGARVNYKVYFNGYMELCFRDNSIEDRNPGGENKWFAKLHRSREFMLTEFADKDLPLQITDELAKEIGLK